MPGLGDASLIGAGTLAGEGRLNVWIVLRDGDGGLDARIGGRVRDRGH